MKVLIAEDDVALREGLIEIMRRAGWETDSAADGKSALQKIAGVDVLVTDVRLPGMNGLDLLREARASRPGLPVIVMTGYGSIPSAVEAMRRGARTYLTKPFEPEELLLHLREVEEMVRLRELAAGFGRGRLVGSSAAMRRAYGEIDAAAISDAPVLITGETGTGKELAARAIHDSSPRKNGPFIAVNLGAIPRDLAESELFGHERGAFTGSQVKKRGRFMLADGGTLFLDEVDSLPLETQPKLLRAIEEKEVWLLGAERAEKTDVRIIAATNSDVEALVRAGSFREDLYYRLNVLRIRMPPLRKRPEDIPQLVHVLLDRTSAPGSDTSLEVSASVLSNLIMRPWPGNVRELANTLERARAKASVAAEPGGDGATRARIEPEHLDDLGEEPDDLPFKEAKARISEEWSKATILSMLARTEGNVSETARALKMNRTALLRFMRKHDIQRD